MFQRLSSQTLRDLWRKAVSSETLRNSGTVLVITVYTTLMGFVAQFLLARGLSAMEFGYYSIATGIIGMATIFCLAGSDTTMMRFTARYWTLSDGDSSRRLFRFIIATGFCIAVVIAVVIFFAGDRIFAITREIWGLTSVSLIPICLSLLFQARLRGLHVILPGFLPEGVARPTVFVVLIGLSLAVGELTSAAQVFGFFLASALASAGLSAAFLRRTPIPGGKSAEGRDGPRQWMRNSLTFLGISLANTLNMQIGVLILGHLSLTVEAGIFGVVIRLSTLAVFLLSVANAVFAPSIVRLNTSGETARLRQLLLTAAGASVLFALPIAGILMIFPDLILRLFGPSFVVGKTALRIAALGFLMHAALGPLLTAMALCGRHVAVARIQYAGAVLNAVLTYGLVTRIGVNAAACGATASLMVMDLGVLILAWRVKFLSG